MADLVRFDTWVRPLALSTIWVFVGYLPSAVLAAVVFLTGLDLIDVAGMRNVYRLRRDEFVVALLTAATVIFVGVLQGILLAIALSIVVHLRHSYRPRNTLETTTEDGRIHTTPLAERAELRPGLAVNRFAHTMYYANANLFAEEVLDPVTRADPELAWFCLEMSAVADVDISAAETLRQVHGQLQERDVRLVLYNLDADVRDQLEHYGTLELIGTDAVFDSVDDVLEAFLARDVPR